MKSDKKHSIIYTFQSLEDPLVKGLILQYLMLLGKSNQYVFHLITHEQPAFSLTLEQKKSKRDDLSKNNIEWYPINYHNGKMLVLKKAFDFIKSAIICFKIKSKYKTKTIVGFLPLAAGFCSILSPILRLKLITYCFEPHSEYMADFGIWKKNSLKYVLLKKYEINQIELSKYMIVPTSYTLEFVNKVNSVSKKFVLPISIDTDKNVFEFDARAELREKYDLKNKFTFLYMGKMGGIYYSIGEIVNFIYAFKDLGNYHFMIISDAEKEINNYLENSKLDPSFFTILDYVPYENLNQFISAADMGIIAVPPLPSQKYRTPVKTSLYLSCGLPYLINKGIAEDDQIALKNRIGVVTNDFNPLNAAFVHSRIQDLLVDSPIMAERCRDYAVKNRSHELAVNVLKNIFQDEFD